LKKIVTIVLVVLLVLAGAVSYISYSAADSLIHSPHEKALDVPENYGYTDYENVSFPAADDSNLTLKAWYFPPSPEKNGATIIYVHGFQAERSWLLSQARFMIDEGYGALMLDLRNSGESDGDTTYFGEKEWRDVEGAVNYLRTRPEVNMDMLGIMGRSMGGGVVIRAQAEMGVFKFVIAQSTFTNVPDLVNDVVPFFTGLPSFPFAPMIVFFGSQQTGIDASAVNSVEQLQRFDNTPILIMHGTEDDWIPFAQGQALYESAKEPKQFYAIEGAKHFPVLNADPEGIKKVLLDFVHEYLK
jgi:dipeptidyl aminopeptidase/acylaminoacyl peptidase